MLAPPPQPSILLAEADDGPGFAVTILPPPKEVGHDRVLADYLRARAYARLLRLQFGWKIVDRCDSRTKLATVGNG